MTTLKKIFLFSACFFACMCDAAVDAYAELSATSTNLVVTEETRIRIKMWLAPMEGDLKDYTPFLNQRPPHVYAAFLDTDWKSENFALVNPRHNPPVASRSRNRDVPVYNLNNYVSDDFFGGMRDPFSLFGDDDFFGRTLGPKAQRFPFLTERVERSGVNGWEFVIETDPYVAIKPGRTEIAPVVVKVQLITGVKNGRDRYGRSVRVPSLKEITLHTRALTIEVSEPPREVRPVSFCGAISSNLTVTASLDASVCTAGDPLLLTLDVSGANDADEVHVPSEIVSVINKTGIFRLDASSLKTETLSASRRFTWRVRTLKAGTVEFPPLEISYYDLGRREYVTIKTHMIPLQVKAGVQAALGALDELDESDEFPMPDGIDVDVRGSADKPLLPHLVHSIALVIIAPLVFILVRLFPPVRRRIKARNEEARRSGAFNKCKRALKSHNDAKKRAAIRKFFAVRYDLNGAAVTAADVERIMKNDYSDEEIKMIVDALTELDMKEYSSSSNVKIVVSLVIVFLATFGAIASSAEFGYKRGCSLAAKAADESAFKAAAQAFDDVRAGGIENEILFMNLAACSLMAGDARSARSFFRRAELYTGETASTRRGLRAAEARLKNDARADLPVTRVFMRPHFQFPLDVRLLFACAMWALGWLIALLPEGGIRRFALCVCIIAALASSVSVAVSFVELHAWEGMSHVAK